MIALPFILAQISSGVANRFRHRFEKPIGWGVENPRFAAIRQETCYV
jgi:hypothetical protein